MDLIQIVCNVWPIPSTLAIGNFETAPGLGFSFGAKIDIAEFDIFKIRGHDDATSYIKLLLVIKSTSSMWEDDVEIIFWRILDSTLQITISFIWKKNIHFFINNFSHFLSGCRFGLLFLKSFG